MERFNYEILHTSTGRASAERLRRLIVADPVLRAASEEWPRDATPACADLYALLLVVTDDLESDAYLCRRTNEIARRGVPIIPIVCSVPTFNFRNALPVVRERNARGLDEPETIISALLHHGGLRRYGTGGQVMISYARADGRSLCTVLREQLEAVGFRCFVDEHELVGGALVQASIRAEIERSDLVLLVDSQGAAKSEWVADEMDMALAAHVPVIAVSPAATAFHHALQIPHVPWEAHDDPIVVAGRAASTARRLLARKAEFRERVWRVLEQLCRLRAWMLEDSAPHMLVRPPQGQLRVACTPERADVVAVQRLREAVGADGRGLLVGGTRPYPRPMTAGLDRAGAPNVRVAPLSRVATRVSEGVARNTLAGRRIFFSAAMPDDARQRELASGPLSAFVITFVQTMFDLGVEIVFGGHPSITPVLHRSVADLIGTGSGRIELHQGRYWLSTSQLPREVHDRRVFSAVCWHGDGQDAVADLGALRDGMIRPDLDGAVFVGGAVVAPIGARPGIVDEHERYRLACPSKPVFVLGLGEGGAATLLTCGGVCSNSVVDPRVAKELAETKDPDLATALIVAELLDRYNGDG